MLRLFAEREEVRVVADQVGTPTWAGDIASAIATLVTQLSQEPDRDAINQVLLPTGIYHFTNSGVASWYDFAVAIFEEAKELGFPLKVQRIVPIQTSEYPTPAQRPAYSVLSGEKIKAVLGTHAPHWRQGLRQMLREFYCYTNKHS
jgi:dTDP-4-dehydrorhamnose reductase